MSLDKTDVRILAELQRDGRQSVVEIAERVGLTHTPCLRRIRHLEDAGVIRGYTAILDPAAVGLRVTAFVQVKLERHADETMNRFMTAVEAIEEVVSCHVTTGNYDFLLTVLAADLESLGNVVLKRLVSLAGVRDMQSSIALRTVKRVGKVPLEQVAAFR
ncbi:MAG: Lrp/AsnC family transcriptional regulator [Pseudomonadota bacterium]|jgi:Lrp/AsnC family leucine-responsive transcriptional regulator